MSHWVRVAAVEEIPKGTGKEVVVEDHILAIFHTTTGFQALDGVCPHAGGPLAKGRLDGSIVTCPWHGRQFDVETGRDCLNANLSHPCFALKVEGTDIWAELP